MDCQRDDAVILPFCGKNEPRPTLNVDGTPHEVHVEAVGADGRPIRLPAGAGFQLRLIPVASPALVPARLAVR